MQMKPEGGSPLWTEGRPIARARGNGLRIVAGFVVWGVIAAIAFIIARGIRWRLP